MDVAYYPRLELAGALLYGAPRIRHSGAICKVMPLSHHDGGLCTPRSLGQGGTRPLFWTGFATLVLSRSQTVTCIDERTRHSPRPRCLPRIIYLRRGLCGDIGRHILSPPASAICSKLRSMPEAMVWAMGHKVVYGRDIVGARLRYRPTVRVDWLPIFAFVREKRRLRHLKSSLPRLNYIAGS